MSFSWHAYHKKIQRLPDCRPVWRMAFPTQSNNYTTIYHCIQWVHLQVSQFIVPS